jgi:NAD(P)-dependent dehydrogenase (short-subunit alcohol dehydrogenase family)
MNIIIVGADSGIGSAIYKKLANDHLVVPIRRPDFELNDKSTWPSFEQKWDHVYYCIGIGGVSGDSVEMMKVNAINSYKFLKDIATAVVPGGRITVLSSRVGSLTEAETDCSRGNIYYRMSKAALNMGVIELAQTHKHCSWQLVHPGFVNTKMTSLSPFIKYAITPDKSADSIIKLPNIQGLSFMDAPSGRHIDW